jgi:uncharacterized protein DUF1118
LPIAAADSRRRAAASTYGRGVLDGQVCDLYREQTADLSTTEQDAMLSTAEQDAMLSTAEQDAMLSTAEQDAMLSTAEQDAIFECTARRVFQLPGPDSALRDTP